MIIKYSTWSVRHTYFQLGMCSIRPKHRTRPIQTDRIENWGVPIRHAFEMNYDRASARKLEMIWP